MSIVWTALTSRIAGLVATAVAVALACFLLAVSIQNVGLKAKVGKLDREINGYVDGKGRTVPGLRANLATCQSNRQGLEDAIKDSNDAVERMKAEAEARRKEGEKAVREARRQTVEANRRVAGVLAARPGQDVCESADRLILESLETAGS